MPAFTADELAYLETQRLGRLATIDRRGVPQNNPVGFRYNPDLDTIDVSGRDLANTRKFRNVTRNPHVAFVVDDIESVQPWSVRGVEIRGLAEAVSVDREPGSFLAAEVIRIKPTRVISWGV